MKNQKFIPLFIAFLAVFLFLYGNNSKDLIFKSDFYLQDDTLTELPSSFNISGDIDFLTPTFDHKINRYLLNSNKHNQSYEFQFSIDENYEIISSKTLSIENDTFKEHIIEIENISSKQKYFFTIVTTNKYFPNYSINIDNVSDISEGYIYTTFKNFRNYTFLEALSLIGEFSYTEFNRWLQARGNTPGGPVFEQTQKFLKNKNAKSNALILDKNGVPLVVVQGNASYADFKYLDGIGNVLGVYGVPPARGILVGKYKVYNDEFDLASEITWSENSYLDVHDLDFDPENNRVLKIGYSQYLPGVSTITDTIWSSSFVIENDLNVTQEWDAFLSFPLGASVDSHVENPNWDVFHINSAKMYGDNTLVSLRHTNSVSMINKNGEVSWTLANNELINDFEIIGDPFDLFFGQHDAQMLDEKTLTIFDNQNNQNKVARGVIYSLDFEKKQAIFQKHYLLTEHALCCGSFQVLQNGSILSGGSEGTIYEFTTENPKEILKIEIGGIVYRAIKQQRTQ